jgi:membrane protease subunit HflK
MSEAQVYAIQTLSQAQSDTQHFDQLLAANALQPKVLRDRLYIQTVQDVLSHARKVFVDARAGSIIYVPLDKLTGEAAQGSPKAAADDAADAAGAVQPSGAGAPAQTPGTAEHVPPAGERQSDEDRSRARGER